MTLNVKIEEVKELPPIQEVKKDKSDTKEKKKKKKSRNKPKYSVNKYKNLPPTKVINKTVVNQLNNRYLADKKEQLKISECEVGEATLYMVDYYMELDPDHPALVMIGACMGIGFRVLELQTQGEQQDKPRKEFDNTQVNPLDVKK